MTAVAVICIASWAGLFVGAFATPDHTIRGIPAVATVVGLLVTSLILAIHAL